MAELKRYDNRLGVAGWFGRGRWGVERYAYALHRLTGLALLAYFMMHIVVTAFRAKGIYLWTKGGILDHAVFRVGELLVFLAFAFHALNGLRLVLVELGFAVGRPIEPVYPYKTSLNVQRPLLVVVMIVAAVLVAAGGWEFMRVSH
jgi:succinate dehydrogenase / fumarate reductase cytochrome b subunit